MKPPFPDCRGPSATLVLAALFFGLSGCDGQSLAVIDGDTPPGAPPMVLLPEDPSERILCPDGPAPELEDLSAYYASEIHPLVMRDLAQGGCAGCHQTGERAFEVREDAQQTFQLAWSRRLLGFDPTGLTARLRTPLESIRMPQGAEPWSRSAIQKVASLACALEAFERVSGPSDEQFPLHLDTPWTGPENTRYENTFIDVRQLEGRVEAIFQDDWVRGGEDGFTKHLALFGGVDYQTRFVAARTATADFFLGLDLLAPDICGRAAGDRTGPFTGIDTAAPLTDHPGATTKSYEAAGAILTSQGGCEGSPDPDCIEASTGGRSGSSWNLWAVGNLTVTYTLGHPGPLRIRVRAGQDAAGSEAAHLEVRLNGLAVQGFDVPNSHPEYREFTFVTDAVEAGVHTVAFRFTNDDHVDGDDRNLRIADFSIEGPLGEASGDTNARAARAGVSQLYSRMLYREATQEEVDASIGLLQSLGELSLPIADRWSGVCEALVRHPDFLFSLPPSHERLEGAAQDRLILVRMAQDLVARPPTPQEFERLAAGVTRLEQFATEYLASPAFEARFFEKMRQRTESDGTLAGDEPARLWTYLFSQNRPFNELLTGDYAVNADFQPVDRPEYHGRTGVLTMPGFMRNKPRLPSYNYPARVMTDFMGSIFEVPPEVFDQRATSTASSTVDPTSVCYGCHRILTPLAYQRLGWSDEGEWLGGVDADGQPIDDSDRGVVEGYPFAGDGLEAFATQAVRKEAFKRRTINAVAGFLFGRELRVEEDERGLYRELWDVSEQTGGNLRAVMEHLLKSPTYRHR